MIIEKPKTLDEALVMLTQKNSVALAGGTNIMVDIKKERFNKDQIVVLDELKMLKGISEEEGGLILGSRTTFDEIEMSKLSDEYPEYRALVEAAASVGGPQIRNRGTVGGNILCASPASDSVPALLVLDAVLRLRTLDNERTVPLEGFVTGVRKTQLLPGELLLDVHLPKRQGKSCFYKAGARNAMAISIACGALYLNVCEEKVTHVRIAYGSVAPTAVRAHHTEDFLEGKSVKEVLTQECLEQAKKILADDISPITDLRATKEYRMLVAGNILEANIRQLLCSQQ